MSIQRETTANIEACVEMNCDPLDGETNIVTNLGAEGPGDTHLESQSPQAINRFSNNSNHFGNPNDTTPETLTRRPKSLFDRSIVSKLFFSY